MVSVSDAQHLILSSVIRAGSVNIPLEVAEGRTLAEDIISPWDHPFFDHSAVDGYAFRFPDHLLMATFMKGLTVVGEIPAGASPGKIENKGECFRIFTGAPIPEGADTVVMQEHVRREGNLVFVLDEKLSAGGNVRLKGEQIKKGDVALKKGTVLSPELVSFLASLGIQKVTVAKKPVVSIIVTGNEFIMPGTEPGAGKIFESNGILLKSWLNRLGFNPDVRVCKDDPATLKEAVLAAFEKCDLLLVTGGASVGDYDFTASVIEAAGLKTVFHKINQKPGKPLLFGCDGKSKTAFGLPGNPLSAAVCFLIYIVPWLYASEGKEHPGFVRLHLPLKGTYSKKDGKTHFKTVAVHEGMVSVLPNQASHMLRCFDGAHGIAIFPENKDVFQDGDLIEILLTHAF